MGPAKKSIYHIVWLNICHIICDPKVADRLISGGGLCFFVKKDRLFRKK